MLLNQPESTPAPKSTPTEDMSSANELLYSHYDFESSPSRTSKRPYYLNVDSDKSFLSTSISVNLLSKRQKADSQISTSMSTNLSSSVKASNIIPNDPHTQKTFHVMKDKHDRQQLATSQELLNKETGFRHLLAYLYSTLFTEEELKVSSVDGYVRGTKAFDQARIAAIDKTI
ncbi:unnamed protein product [Rotaria sp. Silwood1]|nr:unnamed protein product [Rotaria sp. Silwood1]